MTPKIKRFIKDSKGRKVGVVLPIKDFRKIQKELEELESIRAFDAAKASGDEAVPFQQAVSEIERSRKRITRSSFYGGLKRNSRPYRTKPTSA